MAYEKLTKILELARALASTAEGLTLDEMCREIQCERRTVERMRDAIREVFPQLEEIADHPTKRFRIPGGLDGFFQDPSVEELSDLGVAIAQLRRSGAVGRAESLAGLDRKIRAAMRLRGRRAAEVDVEALLRAELIAVRAGPRPQENPEVMTELRKALLGMKLLRFTALTWQKSVDELLRNHTLFPYFSFLMDMETIERAREAAIISGRSGAMQIFQRGAKGSKRLRICKECRKHEEARFGEAYWHRSHQLAGIVVCHIHGIFLTETEVPMGGAPFVAAHDAKFLKPSAPNLTARSKRLLLELSKRAHSVLAGEPRFVCTTGSCWRSRMRFFYLGYGESPKHLDIRSAWQTFRSFFGDEFLQICLGRDVHNPDPFRYTLRRTDGHGRASPVVHLLLDMFFEDTRRQGVRIPEFALVSRYKCPLSENADRHWVGWVTWVRTGDRLSARGTCSCGADFNFSSVAKADCTMPIVDFWNRGRKKRNWDGRGLTPNGQLEREYIEKIRAALLLLRNEQPPRWMTAQCIRGRAGVPYTAHLRPSCRALMKANTESKQEFYKRRISYEFDRQRVMDQNELKRRMGLGPTYKRSKELITLIDRSFEKQRTQRAAA